MIFQRLAAEKIKNELNQQVSDARLLKKPDEKSALAPVLQNLGLKDEQAFPSPEQFVITGSGKSVTKALSKSRRCDVAISLTSSDLAGVLGGTLSPLQAYLTGKITANGDVRKLMFFDKLSNRGHKPGTMFTI